MKTTTDLQKEEILPYPHQTDGEEYPEWEKYGEAFIDSQKRYGTAREYIRAYGEFRKSMQRVAESAREEDRQKITEFAIEGKDQPDEQKGLILYSKIMQYYHKLSSPQQKSKKEDSG